MEVLIVALIGAGVIIKTLQCALPDAAALDPIRIAGCVDDRHSWRSMRSALSLHNAFSPRHLLTEFQRVGAVLAAVRLAPALSPCRGNRRSNSDTLVLLACHRHAQEFQDGWHRHHLPGPPLSTSLRIGGVPTSKPHTPRRHPTHYRQRTTIVRSDSPIRLITTMMIQVKASEKKRILRKRERRHGQNNGITFS